MPTKLLLVGAMIFLILTVQTHGWEQSEDVDDQLPESLPRQRRIIGGQNASPNLYPWAVTIRGNMPSKEDAVNVCGASIIGKRWLVTAAHCFWSTDESTEMDLRNPKIWHIIAGQIFVAIETYIEGLPSTKDLGKPDTISNSTRENKKYRTEKEFREMLKNRFKNKLKSLEHDLSDFLNSLLTAFVGGESKVDKRSVNVAQEKISAKDAANHFHVEKIILHPEYTADDIEYDIALIKLESDLPLNIIPGINAIKLPTADSPQSQPNPQDECVIVGWGCRKNNGEPTTTAQFTKLSVIDFKSCNRIYKNEAGLNKKHEFCAGYVNKGIGICPGDSGGGLACKNKKNEWYIAGVTSATHAEKPGQYPGLFTRVAYFANWIKQKMETD